MQIETGHNTLLRRAPKTNAHVKGFSNDGRTLPRLITLGGDHTITLPLLRSLNQAYGPIRVIHFDSHLYVIQSRSSLLCHSSADACRSDTWKPKVFGGAPTDQAAINHGTYFWHAFQEGLLANDTNIHAGIRTTLSSPDDCRW